MAIGALARGGSAGLKGIRDLLRHASGFTRKDSVREFARENPLATAGLVVPTAMFLGEDVVAPIGRGAWEGLLPFQGMIDEHRDQESFEEYKEVQAASLSRKLMAARMEEMVQKNMAIVAQRDPHLFNQVMAGRVLPKGAVVLGGPRRQDLMEEFAYAMGSSSSEEAFASLVS